MPAISLPSLLHAASHLDGLACFDTAHRQTIVTWGSGARHTGLSGWQEFVRTHTCTPSIDRVRYSGGVVGWIGYEAGRSVERMPAPRAPRATHDVCLWRTDGALVLNHETNAWSVHGSQTFRATAEQLLESTRSSAKDDHAAHTGTHWAPGQHAGRAARYQEGVREVLKHVRAGDVYQVSLAWEQSQIPVPNALQTWLHIRESNPALRGCFLRSGGTEIISNSPELFLEFDATTRTVQSVPIKGTAPWSEGEPARNRLDTSEKERAELTMIVDLVRNDLGRVAAAGSVTAKPREIRKCGDLWHAEQVVQAQIPSSIDAIDVVNAAFPPGSVTGAPKVRAMEVISDLEPGPRGVYTGAIGWFADGGGAHLNVAIRTVTVTGGLARFHVGAGIVADSDPEAEWMETLSKAGALVDALGA